MKKKLHQMQWILSFWYPNVEPISVTTPMENQLIEARSKLKRVVINDKDRLFQKDLLQAKNNLKSQEIKKLQNKKEPLEFLTIKLKPVQNKIPPLVEIKINPLYEELLKKSFKSS